jgi:DNA-binding NarL/FixJ family response regulator
MQNLARLHCSRKHMAKTRILVVDEHPLLRYGIIAFIEGQPDMIACGEADSVPERAEQALGNQAAPDGYRVTIGGWRQLGTS